VLLVSVSEFSTSPASSTTRSFIKYTGLNYRLIDLPSYAWKVSQGRVFTTYPLMRSKYVEMHRLIHRAPALYGSAMWWDGRAVRCGGA
jgi:hypothetical protein